MRPYDEDPRSLPDTTFTGVGDAMPDVPRTDHPPRFSILEKLRSRLGGGPATDLPASADASAMGAIDVATVPTTTSRRIHEHLTLLPPPARTRPLRRWELPDVADATTGIDPHSDTVPGKYSKYAIPPTSAPQPVRSRAHLTLLPKVASHVSEKTSPVTANGPPHER